MQGKIIKGIAGFYYVCVTNPAEDTTEIYECKAKGIFRKDGTRPLVGDDVEMEVLDEDAGKGNIQKILPRKNALIRPVVANVDQALVIFAAAKPAPNFNLLDRFLIMMAEQELPCIICFNKQDIVDEEERQKLTSVYENCGCRVVFASATKGEGTEEIRALLRGKTTTVAGPSGVGKSSMVNSLCGDTYMETGEISEKIDRGKHTTRHAELLLIGPDTYIVDTPGFSSLSVFNMEKEELKDFYPEFAKYEDECRFRGCSHINEPDCGVKNALQDGKISPMRYENYVQIYGELKSQKKWK